MNLLHDYAIDRGLPYDECGKLVVALSEAEEERLKTTYEKAVANGVPDVELVGPDGTQAVEPNAVGRLALYSPHTAIIDYAAVARSLIADVTNAGGQLVLDAEVTEIPNQNHGCTIVAKRSDEKLGFIFDHLVVCAGLAGGSDWPKIVPFFGQYSQLSAEHRTILNGLVYPVPDPARPFLGVKLTKRVDGEMLVGPNAFLSFGRENYNGWRPGVGDSLDVALDPSFWKFASRNVKAAIHEFGTVVSRKKLLSGAADYVPELRGAESTPITRGIRAQAMDRNGHLVDDFVIEQIGSATLVRNAPSP